MCINDWQCPYRQSCHAGACIPWEAPSIGDDAGSIFVLAVESFFIFLLISLCLCSPCIVIICASWLRCGCCHNGDQESGQVVVGRHHPPKQALIPVSSVKMKLSNSQCPLVNESTIVPDDEGDSPNARSDCNAKGKISKIPNIKLCKTGPTKAVQSQMASSSSAQTKLKSKQSLQMQVVSSKCAPSDSAKLNPVPHLPNPKQADPKTQPRSGTPQVAISVPPPTIPADQTQVAKPALNKAN